MPATLDSASVELFPTNSGVVIARGKSFTYLSASNAVLGSIETSLGTLPAPATGFGRKIVATMATDSGVYLSTVDIETASTNPGIGASHVWFLTAGAAPAVVATFVNQYLASLQISPASPTTGFGILVDWSSTPTSDVVPFTIGDGHLLTITGSTKVEAIDASVVSLRIAWATSKTDYVPIRLVKTTAGTTIKDRAGIILATYTSANDLLTASDALKLDLDASVVNPVVPSVSVLSKFTSPLEYGKKVTASATQTSTVNGYIFSGPAAVSVVVGSTSKPLASSGLVAKKNFCFVAKSDASIVLKSQTKKVCGTVSHELIVKVANVKKRKVTITTTAAKITVQVVKVSKKKSKVLTWIASSAKVKISKGVGTVTLKTKGEYRFVAAKSATNAAVTSSPVIFKK
jgi:hypothetical protein